MLWGIQVVGIDPILLKTSALLSTTLHPSAKTWPRSDPRKPTTIFRVAVSPAPLELARQYILSSPTSRDRLLTATVFPYLLTIFLAIMVLPIYHPVVPCW